MSVSDLAALPVRLGAALRGARLFHPAGLVAEGWLDRVAPEGVGLPLPSGPVPVRLSKGVGLPGSLPDVAGLAWRATVDGRPWDVLLASCVGRLAPAPAARWTGTVFSTLMPLGYDGLWWWLRARLVTDAGRGLSVAGVERALRHGHLVFAIEQAPGARPFTPLARLTVMRPVTDGDVAFDPVLHSAPGVAPGPGWLAGLRRAAYRRSREGRHAD
ncbi:phosphodiesterase [uncultured Mycolicibacterium sp.]|uniref:phosphodiesterase n=1 Tax=uncultured Mycolicibacterium sp. TaxID=2320817 RepID=UPI00260DB416|nr:phosphodiesterase [uncultured Mycolicibacterium sp.]